MEAESDVHAAVRLGPYHRCVVLVPLEALGIDFDAGSGQQHAGLGELARGEVVGADPRQPLVSAPDHVQLALADNRLRIHAVVIEHLQRSVSGEARNLGCQWEAGQQQREQERPHESIQHSPAPRTAQIQQQRALNRELMPRRESEQFPRTAPCQIPHDARKPLTTLVRASS